MPGSVMIHENDGRTGEVDHCDASITNMCSFHFLSNRCLHNYGIIRCMPPILWSEVHYRLIVLLRKSTNWILQIHDFWAYIQPILTWAQVLGTSLWSGHRKCRVVVQWRYEVRQATDQQFKKYIAKATVKKRTKSKGNSNLSSKSMQVKP